jgi:hypothetical protein
VSVREKQEFRDFVPGVITLNFPPQPIWQQFFFVHSGKSQSSARNPLISRRRQGTAQEFTGISYVIA